MASRSVADYASGRHQIDLHVTRVQSLRNVRPPSCLIERRYVS